MEEGLHLSAKMAISCPMKSKMKMVLAASLLLTMFVLSACNTVKGVGRDFEAMGESMQRAGD